MGEDILDVLTLLRIELQRAGTLLDGIDAGAVGVLSGTVVLADGALGGALGRSAYRSRPWRNSASSSGFPKRLACRALSGNMTLIDGFRRLLFSLRRHLGWIGRAGNAARAELLALNVVLREVGLDAIWLAFPAHANLPDFPSKRRVGNVVPSSDRSSEEVRALRYTVEADGNELAEIADLLAGHKVSRTFRRRFR
jgi:hypothetical protein